MEHNNNCKFPHWFSKLISHISLIFLQNAHLIPIICRLLENGAPEMKLRS